MLYALVFTERAQRRKSEGGLNVFAIGEENREWKKCIGEFTYLHIVDCHNIEFMLKSDKVSGVFVSSVR